MNAPGPEGPAFLPGDPQRPAGLRPGDRPHAESGKIKASPIPRSFHSSGAFFPSWLHRLSQEVTRMKQRKPSARISRRLGAALLAAATLWTVSVTAGSTDRRRGLAVPEAGGAPGPAALAAGGPRPAGRPVRRRGADPEPVAPAAFRPAGDQRSPAAGGGGRRKPRPPPR